MKHFKVGKYDYRRANYTEEWTNIWDALNAYVDENQCWEHYLVEEVRLLDFAANFLFENDISKMRVLSLENNVDDDTASEFEAIHFGLLEHKLEFKNSTIIGFMDAIKLLQMSLRGMIWAQLKNCENGAYIAAGDDYYWLIGIPDNIDITQFQTEGLYIYEHKDPWE
ncbi:hypothetical protein L2712_18850 [Shewanella marisflavi]|uniref:hypothetical protein n=1 Tax=Shewanella marisflavi TaxID=260364 RepID=UPI00200BD7DE|nr:hypothetical protein [Shewanella marisflavi]MCL1043689.1 hypothetical protein [Shewanella marisflavi]